MRKLIPFLAAAGTALAIASPAAAQYYPQQPYGYGAPQYGYGQNAYGSRNLAMRVDAVQRRIAYLQRAHIIRGDRAERLRQEARSLQRRVWQTSAYGIGGFAQADLQSRLARLEQRVNIAASAGRFGGYGYNNGYGYNGGYNGAGYNSYGYNGYGQQAYGNRDRDDDDRNDGDRYDQDDDD